MNELQNKLIKELETLIAHLNKYKENNWSNNFSKIRKLIDKNDISGIDSLRNIYRGGMGSFNDFYIKTENKKELILANEKLSKLAKSISDLANEIKQEINKNIA